MEWGCAEIQPFWPAERKGPGRGCAFGLKGSEGEPDLAHVSVVGVGAGVRPEPPALGPGLPEHSSVQVSVAWLGPEPPVGVVGHPPLLAAAVCLPPEEASLVDNVVLFHHSSPVSL